MRLLPAPDDAQKKYENPSAVPQELKKKWAIEIEQAKKDIYIKRMWDRQSPAYWMQFLFPAMCVLLACLDPANLVEYLFTAVGGTAAMKSVRAWSKKNYYQYGNGKSPTKEDDSSATPADYTPEDDPNATEV